MNTKQALYQTVVDKGLRKQLLAEGQAKPGNLLSRQREGWREMAQETINGIMGNLPDAEEAQYMIDAEGIEILRHVTEAMPQQTGQVVRPAVGGESPVLSFMREGIRGRPRLRVEIEEFRILMRLHAVAIDAYGQVALQYHTLLAGIVSSSLQLGMQQILYITHIIERVATVFSIIT